MCGVSVRIHISAQLSSTISFQGETLMFYNKIGSLANWVKWFDGLSKAGGSFFADDTVIKIIINNK